MAAYMDMADRCAQAYFYKAPSSLELDDLKQVARLGLINGVQRLHTKPAEAEANYLRSKVRGALLDFLRAGDYVPRSARKIERQLSKLGPGLSEAEQAAECGVAVRDLRKAKRLLVEMRMLRVDSGHMHRADEGEGWELQGSQQITDHSQETAAVDVGGVLAEFVEGLSPLHQTVLALHYVERRELREVASILGIKESRAIAEHTRAILAVYEHMREKMNV